MPPARSRMSQPTASDGELAELTLVEASRALRESQVTAEAYAAALLARHAANRHLNAFISIDPALVLEAARAADLKRATGAALGPLHGLPLAIKDSINTKALPTSAGTPSLKAFRPRRDAAVADRLFGSGAILLGKTNLDELSFGWTTHNVTFGATRNPYDSSRIPGGSSGGTACAVAARLAPAGIGADTVGSVRVPSALCGIVGFRPTPGRYPGEGIVPIAPTLDTPGPMARSVADIALLDGVISGRRVGSAAALKGVRLGLSRKLHFADLDAALEETIERALAKLREAGATLVEAELPELTAILETLVATIRGYEVPRSLAAYLAAHDAPVTLQSLIEASGPTIRDRLQAFALSDGPTFVSAAAYHRAMKDLRPALQTAVQHHLRQHRLDAMIFPTVRVTAPPVTREVFSPAPRVELRSRSVPPQLAFARNISLGSAAGLPGLAIPAGLGTDGLPVGIELDGASGGDEALLRLGLAVESVLGALAPPCLQAAGP
jgi:mandelamide amidase